MSTDLDLQSASLHRKLHERRLLTHSLAGYRPLAGHLKLGEVQSGIGTDGHPFDGHVGNVQTLRNPC